MPPAVPSEPVAPPFGLPLLLGTLLTPLPPAWLQPALSLAVRAVQRRHPRLFDRLGPHQQARFLIDPAELPYVFLLRPDASAPSLTALSRGTPVEASASIRGPFAELLSLLQGESDGDALFFSRRLVIEGDTEAVLALRNALDDAEVDLAEDIAALAGPLGRLMLPLHYRCLGLARRAESDLQRLHRAALQPALDRLARVERRLAENGR